MQWLLASKPWPLLQAVQRSLLAGSFAHTAQLPHWTGSARGSVPSGHHWVAGQLRAQNEPVTPARHAAQCASSVLFGCVSSAGEGGSSLSHTRQCGQRLGSALASRPA